MNSFNEIGSQKKEHPHLYIPMAIFSFGLFAIISFGLVIPYNLANRDIILYASVLPEILNVLMGLIEIAAFAIAFSMIVFSVFSRVSKKESALLLAIYLCALLFRRIYDLIGALILSGSLNLENDIIINFIYLIFDIIVALIVFAISNRLSNNHVKRVMLKSKAPSLFKDDANKTIYDGYALFPFNKIYERSNPSQTCLLIIAIILSASKIISRIIFDIDYGAPEDFEEVLVMIIYYLGDILIGIIFYAICALTISILSKKILKKNI